MFFIIYSSQMGNGMEEGIIRCHTYIQFLIIGLKVLCYDRGDRKRGPTLRKSYKRALKIDRFDGGAN